ncbi:uncharacterized protein EV154DRAFT_516024 [Mucor mucedo]|uniref:uncharacterized protein n=1 Tax=Mucor mucedo TaxID=29922 RepID=UPI00221F22C8|nr:uncharacterized protein EV154DRAFT_516024 [Mucor mucedo]KAI7888949.1 hypothetical protein EV154DRAFT_516024 [Mucor mucedo]
MNNSIYLFDSVELNKLVCTHINTSSTSKAMFLIELSEKSFIVHNLRHEEVNQNKNLPSKTATCIKLTNNRLFTDSYMFRLLQINKHINEIRVNIGTDATIATELSKTIKHITRKGIKLVVERAADSDAIIAVYEKWWTNYYDNHVIYCNNTQQSIQSKRKIDDDMVLLSVPKDKKQRQKFLLEKSIGLLEDQIMVEEPNTKITQIFSKVINTNSVYALSSIDISQCFQTLRSNTEVPLFAKKFMNCVIKFQQQLVYVTGFDLFCHFQRDNDDCATDMVPSNSKKAVAKIQRKTYLSTHFQEISIYFGIYELLLTSGYIATNDCIIPFLGSAITMQLNEQCTEEIYIDTCGPIVINTERLLRQYMKLHSYKPWGFYSLDAFTKGFTPVIPISYHGHVSQKNKDITVHHFASRLLSIVSSNKIITKEMMVDLWLFMVQIPLFTKVSRTNNLQSINFKELDVLLKQSNKYVYFDYLVGISAYIEERAEQKSQFISNMYSQTATKDIALKIGKGGLFGDIKKTNDALMKVMKKALM